MCHRSVVDFFQAELGTTEVEGRRILEVGSRDVNGSMRSYLMSLGAREYVGVDIEPGPGVDRVCDAADLASEFGDDGFDIVVTTEMLEHVRDWRSAVSNLKRVVAPEGLLVVTTRSFGYLYHGFPGDYWRYELHDMEGLFADFQILKLISDPEGPGVFLKSRKPAAFCEIDTSQWKLFSVVKAERAQADTIVDQEAQAYATRMNELTTIGLEVVRILYGVDLADVGQRDFRNLWRSLERLSDQIETLCPRSEPPGVFSPWLRGLERIRRGLLELLTAARLARGRSFGRARIALLESAGGTIRTNSLRVPWAMVDESAFRDVLGTLQAVQAVCLKALSYARPSTRV